MFSKANCLWTILITIFLHIPHSFSGEVYRWTDDKGTIHLTDDVSKIPERYGDQAEKIEVQEETLKEVEKIGKQEEGPDRVNPVRNSSGALNPALWGGTPYGAEPGIVLKSDPTAAAGPEGLWPGGSSGALFLTG